MIEQLLPLAGFAFASSVTPGPNNIMVMASGAHFGVARTLPHIAGIWFGFSSMMVLAGLGFAQLVNDNPGVHMVMKAVAVAFVVFIAWKIARAGPIDAKAGDTVRPMKPHEAALFQAVNPKAWSMALAAMSLFLVADADSVSQTVTIVVMFSLCGLPCTLLWCAMGRMMAGIFRSPEKAAIANGAMALLLIVTVIPMIV